MQAVFCGDVSLHCYLARTVTHEILARSEFLFNMRESISCFIPLSQ